MKTFINCNGKYHESDKAVVGVADHSYRYGDGLFETMRMKNSEIFLEKYHFERLFSGMNLLKFTIPPFFNREKLIEEITDLCKRNGCTEFSRVRLSVSRGTGGVYDCDNKLSYLIECWPLEQKAGLNEKGLVVDIFPDARKSTDIFSNLKSANYLPYVIAAAWAKENNFDDAMILNHHERICDATIANIFWIKDGNIFTPFLSEGCIAGVMRRIILEHTSLGFQVKESVLTEETLLNADEVFLTNVITGIRWVKQCRDKHYQNDMTQKIFNELAQTIS